MAHVCGFRDVNKACHKDLNPLSRIYLLVDSTSGHELLSLMDALQGYHQIMLNPNDSKRIDNHIGDLAEIFRIQRKNHMKLNLAKYTFGVRNGRFLGYMVIEKGIKVDPNKNRSNPGDETFYYPQQGTKFGDRIAVLNRFISRFVERSLPFFKVLRKTKDYAWDKTC
ncbi:UNVERIFIED_CONTAM: hypothetical protein Sradi_4130900 [Sesamum radiatum]|uniref:Uncharacterized protein n=1 Tax=Sesamum radiatum TaxID=300843 RepID=A0AAW2P153_SESRA